MAETSGFFEAELNEETGQWDREYFAHQFASYFKLFFGNGVFGSPTNQLKVLAGDGLKVIVKAGWAFIEGYWYFNEADLELTIDPNTTAFDRQDSIMCRLDMASKKITSVALAGVTDVVRDGNYYDLKLASVSVGVAGTSISNANIVDTRTDQTVCGIVTGVLKVQPTADLFAQFTAQFNLWFETIKGQLSGDVAGNLQNQIGSLPDLKTSVKSSLVEAINELTQKEVDVLDTYEEIMANTTPGKAAGGVGVKEGFEQINSSLKWYIDNGYLPDPSNMALVPIMTSNTTPYGEVITNSQFTNNYDAYKAFTDTISDQERWLSTNTTGQYIAYKFDKKANVKSLYLNTHNVYCEGQLFGAFKLQASNDGSTWSDIYSDDLSAYGEKNYSFGNENYYSYYRILSTSSEAQYRSFCRVQFYGMFAS